MNLDVLGDTFDEVFAVLRDLVFPRLPAAQYAETIRRCIEAAQSEIEAPWVADFHAMALERSREERVGAAHGVAAA